MRRRFAVEAQLYQYRLREAARAAEAEQVGNSGLFAAAADKTKEDARVPGAEPARRRNVWRFIFKG